MSNCWTKERWTTETIQLNPYVSEANTSTKQAEYGPQYYSQRGDDCPPREDKSLNEYLSHGEEYAYLFVNDEWVCYDRHEFDDKEPELIPIPAGALAV